MAHGDQDNLLALACSLEGILDKSYLMLKPVVDDACKHPETLVQNDLEHLFDAALDIQNEKGKRLFDQLRKTFLPIYPECVRDYIAIEREMNATN